MEFLNDSVKQRLGAHLGKLIEIREKSGDILKQGALPSFTDHSLEHSDAVAHNVLKLIATQDPNSELTGDELFVLLSSCYLHDIGMAWQTPFELQCCTVANSKAEWDTFPEKDSWIRDHHAEVSRELVMKAGMGDRVLGFHLEDNDLCGEIAELCEAHVIPTDDAKYAQLMVSERAIRMQLISGLLRVADILDENMNRAKLHVQQSRNLDLTSKVHWYRNYSVKSVVFEVQNRTITLNFGYASDAPKDVHDVVKKLQFPYIEEEWRRHAEEFTKQGVTWTLKAVRAPMQHSTNLPIPDDVMSEMRRLANPSMATPPAPQDVLERLHKEVASLEKVGKDDSIPAFERARALELAADEYAKEGFRWNERSALASATELFKEADDSASKLRTVSREARLQTELGHVRYGYQALQELANSALASGEKDVAGNAFLEAASASISALDFDSAEEQYSQAVAQLPEGSSGLGKFLVELMTAYLLLGDLENAERISNQALALPNRVEHEPEIFEALRTIKLLRTGVAEYTHGTSIEDIARDAEAAFLSGDLGLARSNLEKAIANCDDPDFKMDLQWNLIRVCGLIDPTSIEFQQHTDLNDLVGSTNADRIRIDRALRAAQAREDSDVITSLALTWTELRSASGGVSWYDHQRARINLARQFAQHGATSAVHQAIQSLDIKLATEIASSMADSRRSDLIEAASQFALQARASLLRPPALAVLTALAPYLSDQQRSAAFEMALEGIGTTLQMQTTLDVVRPSWELVGALGQWVGAKEIDRLVSKLDSLDLVNSNALVVQSVVRALRGCVDPMQPSTASDLAEKMLALVDTRPNLGYEESVALVVELAKKCSPERKSAIGERLIPPGESVDAVRMNHISEFGRRPIKGEQFAQWSNDLIDELGQTFQVIDKGAEPVAPKFVGFNTRVELDEKIAFSYQVNHQALYMLELLFADLDDEQQRKVIDVLLRLASEPENLTTNREQLLAALYRILDKNPKSNFTKVAEIMLAIADGTLISQRAVEAYQESQNPLNPFKMDFGDPRKLRRTALLVAAKLVASGCTEEVENTVRLVERFLASHDPHEKSGALLALRYLGHPESVQKAMLISALYSPHVDVMKEAARSISYGNFELTESEVQWLWSVVSDIALSPEIGRRIWATRIAKQMEKAGRNQFDTIINQARNDIDARIRSIAEE